MKLHLLKQMSLVILLLLASCQEDEFMPQPEGEKIPYDEVTTILDEVLETSGYSIFKTLWDGSHMDSILSTQGEAQFTFLVPDDPAFEAAGLTASVATEMPAADKDSLLSYHVLIGSLETAMDPEVLPVSGYLTFLKQPVYTEMVYSTGVVLQTYTYKHYPGINGNDLLIDGNDLGAYEPVPVVNGLVCPVNRVLMPPASYMYEVLLNDERFSMFVGILQATDERYHEIALASGRNLTRNSLALTNVTNGYVYRVYSATLLVPTNEAFYEAGFNSIDDLMAFNVQRGEPHMQGSTMVGAFPTDSLLDFHLTFGALFHPDINSQANQNWLDTKYFGPSNYPVLFSNCLDNKYFTDTIGNPQMYMDFTRTEDGRLQIKEKGSSYEPATVIEPDINTMNGPIHVVDRIIIPKNFKLEQE